MRRITKSAPIAFRLSKADEEHFHKYLEENYLTASEVARELVSKWLREKTQEQPSYASAQM